MPTEVPPQPTIAPTEVPVAAAANTQRQNQSTPLQQPQQIATTQYNYEVQQQQQTQQHAVTYFRNVPQQQHEHNDAHHNTHLQQQHINDFGLNDVLCGRGGAINNNPGNIKFRELVDTKKGEYNAAKRGKKELVARDIVEAWRAQDPPGQFLKYNKITTLWSDIGDDKAVEKTFQTLKDSKEKKKDKKKDDSCQLAEQQQQQHSNRRRRKRSRRTVPQQQLQVPQQQQNAVNNIANTEFTNMNQQERITFYKTSLGIQYASDPLAELHNNLQTRHQQLEGHITQLEGQKNASLSDIVNGYTKEIREKEIECWLSISQNPDNAQQLQSQHKQSIAELQRSMIDQTNYQQGQIQQQINSSIQLRDMLRYKYESLLSSINPPPDYGKCEPSVLPGRSSGYLERLRLLSGAPELPLSHQKLMFKELKHRRLDINYGAPTVNGAKMQHMFTADMFSDSKPKFTMIIEDDPILHSIISNLRYFTQVARDKHIMEWISRHGKIPLLLRFLHKTKSTNRVPDDLIIWFIQLMVHTDFLGAPSSVVVLVSIGPMNKRWIKRNQQYVYAFSGKGGCQVLGFELIEVDGIPSFRVVDYSDPNFTHFLRE